MSLESSASMYLAPSPVFLSSSASTPSISPSSSPIKHYLTNEYISTITNEQQTTHLSHSNEQDDKFTNRGIKSFLKLLKPSIYKKRSKKIYLSTSFNNSISVLDSHPDDNKPAKKVTLNDDDIVSKYKKQIARINTVKKRSPGVLITNPLVKKIESDSNTILYRNRMSLNRRKLNQASLKLNKSKLKSSVKTTKAKRAFSMLTPSTQQKLEPVSFTPSTIIHKKLTSSSKELTWYKLEELDHYYKILEHVMEETSANILNVIEILQEKFIILSGGCTRNGSLIFTFTDNCNENEIKADSYRKAIDYFCNIPSESDKQNGFTILIDRRNDKWSSVKNVLILIQDYFPAKLNTIFILRPQSYFQRVLSSIFFQEDSFSTANSQTNSSPTSSTNSTSNSSKNNLNIKVFKTIEQLYEFIDRKNLTTEFGGSIHYRHQEWIEQRQFIEKLSSNVNECVSNLKLFIKSMEETDFPNDVNSTEHLIDTQLKDRAEILNTVLSTRRFGETVLDVIERTSKIDMYQNKADKYSALTPDIRIHYHTVYNLLKLMEESEKTLNMFWENHFVRLNKCLDLRKFEQKFKDVRIKLLNIFDKLNEINDENLLKEDEYENCIKLLQILNEQSQNTFNEALSLHSQGLQLLKSNCITNNNTTRTSSSGNESFIDLTTTTNTNESQILNTIDLNSTLEIKIDLKSNSIVSTNNNNNIISNKLSIDSGVGTVTGNANSRNTSNKSGTTLIQVNPANMHSNNYNFDNVTIRNCYSYYDYDENNNDNYDDDYINDDIFVNSNRIKIDIVNNNNAGYCVDSVEPKCNELKRLIEEFKIKYATKIKLINDNKLLTEKLNIIKNVYLNGLKLFNDQQLSISMTQEKAKQYIKEIDNWLNEMGTLETTTSSFDLSNIFNDSSRSVTKSFSLLSLDDAYNAYANAIATCLDDDPSTEMTNANLLKATAEEILINSNSLAEQDYNLNLKKENLINSIQYLNTQLISLRDMFEKRQDQLRNSRFLINNHIISVKHAGANKQLFSNLDDETDDTDENEPEILYEEPQIKENLFSDLNLDINEIQTQNGIIKRDSMHKAYDKGNMCLKNNNNLNDTELNNNNNNKTNTNSRKQSDDSSSSSINEEIELEEQKKSHEKKLKHILNELIETERVYVSELKLIIEGYLMKLSESNNYSQVPSIVLANKEVLFGNIKEIYQFHSKIFLYEMESIQNSISDIAKLFMKCKSNFYFYSTYCLNKPHSEEIWREYCSHCPFFKSIQLSLGLKLPLDTYLLKPVQRISKYQLLLKELHKCCNSSDKPIVEKALDTMLEVVNNLNDVMHASFIIGLNELKSQGRLLKRDQLQMTKLKRNINNRTSSSAMNVVNRLKLNESNKCVELFLFEKSFVICKRKADDPSAHINSATSTLVSNANSSLTFLYPSSSLLSSHSTLQSSSTATFSSSSSNQFNFQYFYQFKEILKTNEIGLTENIKNEKRKFEIWSDTSSYIFEASSEQEKQSWISQIKNLLETQLNEIKYKYQSLKLENNRPTNWSTSLNSSASMKLNPHIINPNLKATYSLKYNSSPSSSSSSSTSSSSSSTMSHTELNNRAISFDCDLDLDISDFSSNISPYSNIINYDATNNIKKTNGKVVTVTQGKKSRRISAEQPNLLFTSKLNANSVLTIDNDKIMSF